MTERLCFGHFSIIRLISPRTDDPLADALLITSKYLTYIYRQKHCPDLMLVYIIVPGKFCVTLCIWFRLQFA